MRSAAKPLGEITVITGSMFAGKSEELIRLARRALYARHKIQVFKPTIDDRYSGQKVVTHMGVSFQAIAVSGIKELRERLVADVETVLIEEAQFFDSSIVDLAQELADQRVHVIIAGLDQDFRRKPFGPMPDLMAIADHVIKLKAICMNCGNPASHTYRMIDGRPAHRDDPLVLIGATESYEARCRNCFKLRGEPKRPRNK